MLPTYPMAPKKINLTGFPFLELEGFEERLLTARVFMLVDVFLLLSTFEW